MSRNKISPQLEHEMQVIAEALSGAGVNDVRCQFVDDAVMSFRLFSAGTPWRAQDVYVELPRKLDPRSPPRVVSLPVEIALRDMLDELVKDRGSGTFEWDTPSNRFGFL